MLLPVFTANYAVRVASLGLFSDKLIFSCKGGIQNKATGILAKLRGNEAAFLEIFVSNMLVPACTIIMYKKV